ncbi:MAG: hypothetical protein ABFS02_14565 [Pseudomonadota bacterium]
MKKALFLSLCALLLTGCNEEKTAFETAVLENMQKDTDLKDYKIDPEYMASCVIDMTAGNMPGLTSFDPRRAPYYDAYTKLINMNHSQTPEATLTETAKVFGSQKEAMKAYLGYSQSVMSCISTIVSEGAA